MFGIPLKVACVGSIVSVVALEFGAAVRLAENSRDRIDVEVVPIQMSLKVFFRREDFLARRPRALSTRIDIQADPETRRMLLLADRRAFQTR